MADRIFMYDQKEKTDTRYVGFVGDSGRFDLMIVTTAHFYGKKVVICLQTSRAAILDQKDAANAGYLAEAFALPTEAEAQELSEFLLANI
ncbi:DUF3055 domain-containing protein [Effusibacillus pohliae]|uniref:DUF3055 domain-containing protein n=1 Tax=Effusibacillus pohliae TaxID=232270 RepID=UPI00039AA8D8|nr:DUF3055 domain-containing protein [Effusibacillus pohliae]